MRDGGFHINALPALDVSYTPLAAVIFFSIICAFSLALRGGGPYINMHRGMTPRQFKEIRDDTI